MPETVALITEKNLEEIVSRVVAAVQPEKVILFGSRARGEHHGGSDVDLLVIVDAPDDQVGRFADAAYMALIGTGVAVDIVVHSQSFVDRFGDLIGTVVRPAFREGKVLYERGSSKTSVSGTAMVAEGHPGPDHHSTSRSTGPRP